MAQKKQPTGLASKQPARDRALAKILKLCLSNRRKFRRPLSLPRIFRTMVGLIFCHRRQLLTLHTDSGFLVFKFHECQLSRANLQLEVIMDDHLFPTYVSQRIRTKTAKIEDSKLSFDSLLRLELTRHSRRYLCARARVLQDYTPTRGEERLQGERRGTRYCQVNW